jgi:hypothetical protein
VHRVLAAIAGGVMKPTPGVHLAYDPDCTIYRGAGCNCVPDISVSGPDGVTIIDEHGQGRKRARS